MQKASRGPVATARDNGAESRDLRRVARQLSATIGLEFFQAIARHLAAALTADAVLIGEFLGGREERCRSVAAWMDGAPAEFEYPLAESATAAVLQDKPGLCRTEALGRCPSDTLFQTVRAEACIGVPLVDAGRNPIGALMALFRRPVSSARGPRNLLGIFADRASAELCRKQQEDKLRESEERYRVFIARNSDAMWRIEFDSPIPVDLTDEEQFRRIYETGYFAECNDAAARMIGLEKAEQLVGSRLTDILPPLDPTNRNSVLLAIHAGYKPTTSEINPIDTQGHERHMLRSMWGIIENGRLERIWGSNRDIGDLRYAEKALDASEQRMASLLEAMHLLVVILDPKGAVAFCNEYLYSLTGWCDANVLGKDWLATMIPVDERARVKSAFERGMKNPSEPIHFESTLLGPDGHRRHLDWDSTLLRGSDGAVSARALIGKDTTEFRALEEQLHQAQKLATIGRLAGSVAHDFNNLLTVILGYATVLLDKLSLVDPGYVGLSEIRKAAEEGADLSRRLLTFSRHQVLRPRVVQLNALVVETRQMLGTLLGDKIQLVLNLQPDAGSVRVDASYFHQVLLNLATNARDAMPQGGMMTILTSNVDIGGPAPHPAGLAPGPFVLLTIADTGTGMTEEVREHLFEPFFTTKEIGKGTGLGLSTVYGIVKQSGGEILVESAQGRGTTFRIYLPRIDEHTAPAPGSAEDVPMPHGTETILLVEDREDVHTLAARVLQDLGYSVLEADGIERAMGLSREYSEQIDLLLVSVSLSKAAGEGLADTVKLLSTETRILFISESGEEPPPGLSERGFECIQTPFTPISLAKTVRELLDHGREE